MKQLALLFLSLCLLFPNAAVALRCGDKLLALGDYKEDVIAKCGEPESVESHVERRGSSYFGSNSQFQRSGGTAFGQQQFVEIEVIVDEWVYDFGRRRFQQYLRFENGRLKEIRRLNRGG